MKKKLLVSLLALLSGFLHTSFAQKLVPSQVGTKKIENALTNDQVRITSDRLIGSPVHLQKSSGCNPPTSFGTFPQSITVISSPGESWTFSNAIGLYEDMAGTDPVDIGDPLTEFSPGQYSFNSYSLDGVMFTLSVTNALGTTITVSGTCNCDLGTARATSAVALTPLGPGNCAVTAQASGTGTAFVVTGPGNYVFSAVYRVDGTYSMQFPGIKIPGTYTFTAYSTNNCGQTSQESRTFTVGGTACN